MSWQNIEGHDEIAERFRRALAAGRLPSTFLFVGPPGIGKRTFALQLAKAMLCERRSESDFDPCGLCEGCAQVEAQTHPDLELVAKPPDKNVLPVDLFIGDREHRNREGLCPRLAKKPFRGGRKIAIVDDADGLHEESANCLLKTLEEPPPRSVLILIGTSEHRQLPTIRSRCQIVRFSPLSEATVAKLLVRQGLCDDEQTARQLAGLSQGSLTKAMAVAAEGVSEVRDELFRHFAESDPATEAFAERLSKFVEAAGKDGALKRDRLRIAIGWGQDFYRALARQLSGLPAEGDERLRKQAAAAAKSWPRDAEAAALCLECCLDAYDHVERNVNTRTLLEWWLDELALIARTGAGSAAGSWLVSA